MLSVAIRPAGEAQEVKPLDSYPKVDRLWLGTDEGVIRPGGYEAHRSGSEGFIRLHVADGARVKKGQCWATINPDQLEAERKSLEMMEKRLEMQLEEIRHAFREEQSNRNTELHELEKKRHILESAASSTDIPAALRERAGGAIGDIDAQIELARKRVDKDRLELELDLRLEEEQLKAQRQRNQLELLERRSRLCADFDGELRLSDRVREELGKDGGADKAMWLDANQHIATLVNEERYEITVPRMKTPTGGLPPSELLAVLHDGHSGRLISGDYIRSEEEDQAGEIVRKFMFQIRENSIPDARNAVGHTNLVHIYRRFDDPIHLIFKKDIAFASPGILEKGGWVAVVRHLWKDAEVLQVGPKSIAIKAKP